MMLQDIQLTARIAVSIVLDGSPCCGETWCEDDISDGWWRMIAQGVPAVSCKRVRFNPAEGRRELEGDSFRLCG